MKVSWKQFAQRRKITLERFNTLSFGEYCKWCELRNVIPTTEESYNAAVQAQETIANSPVEEPIAEEPVTKLEPNYSIVDLRKMKKLKLENLCSDNEIEFPKGATKRQLVNLLSSLNN